MWKKDGWRNVIEHQAVQLRVVRIMSDLLGLSLEDKRALETVALVHDWGKRIDKKPEDFIERDRSRALEMLNKVNPDEQLMEATGPGFIVLAINNSKRLSFLQYLQFYLDDICSGSEIVPFDKRINEVELSRSDLNTDPDLTNRLGGNKYWDMERMVGHRVEQMIFDRLIERGVVIEDPSEIPALIKSRLCNSNSLDD